jgi:hypothetical protein
MVSEENVEYVAKPAYMLIVNRSSDGSPVEGFYLYGKPGNQFFDSSDEAKQFAQENMPDEVYYVEPVNFLL